jgi:site-specific DNA recombinase
VQACERSDRRSCSPHDPDSDRITFRQRRPDEYVTAKVPELRLISDDLWERVKCRQRAQSARVGARVKHGLTLAQAGRTGKRPKYLFSGLLKCAVCGSSFAVTGPSQSYTCASRTNGGEHACANAGRVPRVRVESELLSAIKGQLLGHEYQALFAEEVRRLLSDGARQASAAREARRARIGQLSLEVERYADAIASGLNSATLRERLAAAEAEQVRLRRDDNERESRSDKVIGFLPGLADRYERIVSEAERALLVDVERARESLRGFIGDVRMIPGERQGELIAEARIDGAALIRRCLNSKGNISVVAGA